jgi:hypothetical protein
VKLSQIMGHSGFITDEEFNLCREHALKSLETFGERKNTNKKNRNR